MYVFSTLKVCLFEEKTTGPVWKSLTFLWSQQSQLCFFFPPSLCHGFMFFGSQIFHTQRPLQSWTNLPWAQPNLKNVVCVDMACLFPNFRGSDHRCQKAGKPLVKWQVSGSCKWIDYRYPFGSGFGNAQTIRYPPTQDAIVANVSWVPKKNCTISLRGFPRGSFSEILLTMAGNPATGFPIEVVLAYHHHLRGVLWPSFRWLPPTSSPRHIPALIDTSITHLAKNVRIVVETLEGFKV